MHNDPNPSRITSLIWQGPRPTQGTALFDAGFRGLCLCAEEHQPRPELFPGLDVVVSVPLRDDMPTSEETAAALVASNLVASVVASGRKVLITCNMGYNRSGLVTALTLMRLRPGDSTDEIVAGIRASRPTALSNEFFVDYLKSIDRRTLNKPKPYHKRARMPARARAGSP